MLGAMDAAHCTFPLTRGILIDFGMYGPGKEIIPIAFAHYCGNEDRECCSSPVLYHTTHPTNYLVHLCRQI